MHTGSILGRSLGMRLGCYAFNQELMSLTLIHFGWFKHSIFDRLDFAVVSSFWPSEGNRS